MSITPTENHITVIFADDHEMMVEGFFHAYHGKELNIVATACNGTELLQKVREHQPRVVVTDMRMPGMSGKEVTAIIKKEFPGIHVLAFTAYDDLGTIKELKLAGVKGIVIKTAGRADLLKGVIAASRGEEFYCATITKVLMENAVAPPPPDIQLTPREVEVMCLLCIGLTNKEVAHALRIRTRTVEGHRAALYKKTGCKGLIELALFASKHGFV